MHVLCNTRTVASIVEQGEANEPRSGRGKPWAAKQQAARLIWPGDFMNLYNIKYYRLVCIYYTSIVVRGLLLVVFKPLSLVFATMDAVVSEWEPSKPLHKSSVDDIDYDKHLGI